MISVLPKRTRGNGGQGGKPTEAVSTEGGRSLTPESATTGAGSPPTNHGAPSISRKTKDGKDSKDHKDGGGAKRETYFLPYQARWIRDESRLKVVEKSRQIGFSYCDSYDSVRKAGARRTGHNAAADQARDVWVMSRDEVQAKEYIRYCKRWANVLKYAAEDHGETFIEDKNGKPVKVQQLTFATGVSIYALSSNPDAIVGKTGHVKLDEFALHKDQRTLYAVAKPVTQWGGTLSIISTHRGVGTVFNEIVRDIKERGNRMGWSLHTVPIQTAVEQGLVEKINAATGRSESRQEWLARQRAECIDEEQWLQEYCCVPADESTAFITYEMITGAEVEGSHRPFEYLAGLDGKGSQLYLGFDVARTRDLSVIDVEEKVGDVFWERMRVEMQGVRFSEQEEMLYRLLSLPALRRGCIDSTGLGAQLAERAVERFGFKVEAVRFSGPVKEELAFPLRHLHEDHRIRYPHEEKLRADLRGIKKEVTAAGNIRFVGDGDDSHCDRFWGKALAIHAGEYKGGGFYAACV